MHRMLALAWTLAAVQWAGAAPPPPDPTQDPNPTPAQTPPPAGQVADGEAPANEKNHAEVVSAAALLRALETSGEGMTTLSADIRYDRRFLLQGDRHVRDGQLYFMVNPTPGASEIGAKGRTFAIHFDELFVGDRMENDPQTWIFDGRWLTEVRPAIKRLTRREVVREGERFDPLRIGEGPMPIPIGQKAADILARYDAVLLSQDEGAGEDGKAYLAGLKEDAWQLLLTPRKDRPDKDEFREIRLWYSKATLLPRLARTVNRAGDESYVALINLRRNEPLPERAFSVPEAGDAAWEVHVETLPQIQGR